MAQELNKLINKRGQLRAQITRFNTFLDNCELATAVTQISKRLEKIESTWNEFNGCQDEIEVLDQTQVEYRVGFEEFYFNSVSRGQELLDAAKPSRTVLVSNSDGSNNSSFNIASKIKLPTLKLTEFSGSYTEFNQFLESFNSLVHDNSALTGVQKFFYLKSCLQKEPLQVISSLEVTETNYEIALQLLKNRYENKRIIIHNHIKRLVELAGSVKESGTKLRYLLDETLKHSRALKNLGEKIEYWDSILVFLLSSKLDPTTRKAWEVSLSSNTLPSFRELTDFLTQRCQALESLQGDSQAVEQNTIVKNNKGFNKTPTKFYSHVAASKIQCVSCGESHYIYRCEKLRKLSVKERIEEIKRLKLCLNCLKSGHFARECPSGGCKMCQRKHNTMLHLNETSRSATEEVVDKRVGDKVEKESSQPDTVNVNTLSLFSVPVREVDAVILSTAIVYVQDVNNKSVKCRALLDTGSMCNFMTNELLRKLNLPTEVHRTPICGINAVNSVAAVKTQTKIRSVYTSYTAALSFIVLDNISGRIPSRTMSKNCVEIPENINLADPRFNESQVIDLLLGAEIFYELLCVGQIRFNKNQPILQKSKLGWLVSGPVANLQDPNSQSCLLAVNQREIQKQLERFWRIEEADVKDKMFTREESLCEQHFVDTYKRDVNGRIIVSLPIKQGYSNLGNTMLIALKRFDALERKFRRDEKLRKAYSDFMLEYERLGHMSRIPDAEVLSGDTVYYLPHHPVEKQSSETTKLRVVFNASQVSSSGQSLNDLLLVGPNIQDELVNTLMRFRKHVYVLKADIAKMYRQINVDPSQRDLQRIVWRPTCDESLVHYRLNTITYGTASASFIATRCLKQIALEHLDINPTASKAILNDFYMDDLLTGCDTMEAAHSLRTDLQSMLNKYGFELRQWLSNNEFVVNDNRDDLPPYYITNDKALKTLGVIWDSRNDTFGYASLSPPGVGKVSKRSILAAIASIFDPLGLVSPVLMLAKVILQDLWRLNLGWDESIPQELYTKWVQLRDELELLNSVTFPRLVVVQRYVDVQIHGYADASNLAYGACVYLRTTDSCGRHMASLVIAKGRVAPLRPTTIPRLELCGALLLARLMARTLKALSLPVNKIFCWTDSQIVLAWIASEPANWQVFVCNRVNEIQELTGGGSWNHVSSQDNPADILSRGCDVKQLDSSELWRFGPHWLSKDQSAWPKAQYSKVADVPEARKINLICINKSDAWLNLINKYSSYSKLQRVFAYILRFINNLKGGQINSGSLKLKELNKATIVLVKVAQVQMFPQEIAVLKRNQTLAPTSKLLALSPFLDEHGVLRVGGRLKNSTYSFSKKHPALLSSDHHLTKLIVNYEHQRLLHAGNQAVLASLRDRFWPLNGRNTVRKELRNCMKCFRAQPRSIEMVMGQLPDSRLQITRPFAIAGVDYCGPFLIKDGTSRNRKFVKVYICLFICFNTKAIHLELAGDLSTESFLSALRRFVARRGLCVKLYSDNATNFVGARNEMREVKQRMMQTLADNSVKEFLLSNKIEWSFVPPRAPHFAGLWERGVRSIKHHLRRVLSDARLTFESFYTVLTQVEAVVNSRPLCALSTDPNDLDPLTPGHFLIGSPLTSFPEEDLVHSDSNRLSQFQRRQQLTQHFWSRWSKEYINELQQRTKWRSSRHSNLTIGQLVLLKEDNVPPLCWKLGRIVNVFPGSDGIVRVVEVLTKNERFKRAWTKVCPLPDGQEVVEQSSRAAVCSRPRSERIKVGTAVGILNP